MSTEPDLFEQTLETLQNYDGVHWLRILGQTHWQYNELPFWILLRDREEIADATHILQKSLLPLQGYSNADVTVSFITFENDRHCSHGVFKGEEFFEKSALEDIYEEPQCRARRMSVFDYAYPNDPWAIKAT